jgi:hypothetical protein
MEDTTNIKVFLLTKNLISFLSSPPFGFHFAVPLKQIRFLLDMNWGYIMSYKIGSMMFMSPKIIFYIEIQGKQ